MPRLILAAALFCALIGVVFFRPGPVGAGPGTAPGGLPCRFGVLDLDRAADEAGILKQIQARLEDYKRTADARLLDLQKKLQKEIDELQADLAAREKAVPRDEPAIARLKEEINARTAAWQGSVATAQGKLDGYRQRLNQWVQVAIKPQVERLARTHHVGAVLLKNSVVWADNELDLTAELVRDLKVNPLTLLPTTMPD